LRILLHSCCAPCTTFPASILRAEGFLVEGIFYNPNIFPDSEEEKRWSTYREYAARIGLKVFRPEGSHAEWRSFIAESLEGQGRCGLCYRMRLIEVARVAREKGYDCFSTTLLVSPYQDHLEVKRSLEEASRIHSVPYIYRDFRVGYRRSREMARGQHLYMQKYCGCEFSLGR